MTGVADIRDFDGPGRRRGRVRYRTRRVGRRGREMQASTTRRDRRGPSILQCGTARWTSNLTGAWPTPSRPAFRTSGDGGSVVLVSSTAGIKGIAGAGHYSAAKHAVVGLARNAGQRVWGAQSIRVNSVQSGFGTYPDDHQRASVREPVPGHRESHRSRTLLQCSALATCCPFPGSIRWTSVMRSCFSHPRSPRYMTGCQLVVDAGPDPESVN